MGANRQYFTFIDGLRALAVLSIFIFHLFPTALTGGYVGVDVFFVISGFLITSIIAKEITERSFSFKRFYIHRVRRILPAFFVVLFACWLVAMLVMIPENFYQFAKSTKYSALFISNILFQRRVDYFERSFDDNPLLHTWSLSVEEQFYLLWPLLMVLVFRYASLRIRPWVIAAVLLLSFGLCQYYTLTNVNVAFFSFFTRVWEFGLGAIIALGLVPSLKGRPNTARSLSALGLAMIIASVLVYDGEMLFPGYIALLPALGAALVIYGGIAHASLSHGVLSLPPLRWVGKISYSMYLWHWPVICFVQAYLQVEQVSSLVAFYIVVMTTLFSYWTWRYVEVPFRQKKEHDILCVPLFFASKLFVNKSIFVALCAILVANIGYISVQQDRGWKWRMSGEVHEDYESNYRKKCFFYDDPEDMTIFTREECALGADGAPVKAVLIGDSHAMNYTKTITGWAEQNNIAMRLITAPVCPPFFTDFIRIGQKGSGSTYEDDICTVFTDQVQAALVNDYDDIDVFFLSGRWALYTETTHQKGFDRLNKNFITDEGNQELSVAASRTGFDRHLAQTVADLRKRGKTVVLLGDVPSFSANPIACEAMIYTPIYRLLGRGQTINSKCLKVPVEYVKQRNAYAVNAFEQLAAADDGVHFFNPLPYFCDDEYCYSRRDEKFLYADDDHLNKIGAGKLRDAFAENFGSSVSVP